MTDLIATLVSLALFVSFHVLAWRRTKSRRFRRGAEVERLRQIAFSRSATSGDQRRYVEAAVNQLTD